MTIVSINTTLKQAHNFEHTFIGPRSAEFAEYLTYLERLHKARLPSLTGTSQHILNALIKSMGCPSSNSMLEAIAADMKVSKRTLQRHLQKDGLHFQVLKDKVRLHYAMKCFFEDNMSIAQTAHFLGFPSRSSFTYAFKNWTSLSPTVFVKLYRDYF